MGPAILLLLNFTQAYFLKPTTGLC